MQDWRADYAGIERVPLNTLLVGLISDSNPLSGTEQLVHPLHRLMLSDVARMAVAIRCSFEVRLSDDALDRLDRRSGVVQHRRKAMAEHVRGRAVQVDGAADSLHHATVDAEGDGLDIIPHHIGVRFTNGFQVFQQRRHNRHVPIAAFGLWRSDARSVVALGIGHIAPNMEHIGVVSDYENAEVLRLDSLLRTSCAL